VATGTGIGRPRGVKGLGLHADDVRDGDFIAMLLGAKHVTGAQSNVAETIASDRADILSMV